LEKLILLNPTALYYSHFGKATGAVEKLQTYANQLKLWVSISEQGLRNKQSFEAIRDKILDSDESVRKAVKYVKAHPILAGVVFDHSVQGALEFVEKYGDFTPK
jgi:hypothetical protein